MKKLAIVTSHPIQYNAPLFRLLAERKNIDLKVFYTWGQTEHGFVYDPDFKKEFKWDIPLLDGYDKEFVENISKQPSAGEFKGIKNADIFQRIDRYNPDALLVFGWSFHSHLQVLRRYNGKKKILFRGDSNLLDEKQGVSPKKILRRLFLRWVYRHIDIAMYTGEANKAYYKVHGVDDTQLVYAGHAVDNDRFFDADGVYTSNAKALRNELGIAQDELVFLFAGKLEPKKDPGLLIDAFLRLSQHQVRLIMVGNGVLEQELKQKAADDSRIVFLGFQNQQQMPVIYRLGDVFVLPSKGPGETWGLCVNEAMASGRPVIVSDRCGCAGELISGNGKAFRAGDLHALYNTMLFFAEHREALVEMGNLSQSMIKSFSFERIAAVTEELI
ncbi:glycosyltransferase family 4 protein [Lacibacter sp. H407]|uniref:glycosyltransferase family 4 protein n=1 Tax=Lacibacter sp. H407 TaxID=3133423 RepID=UPI0030BABF17